MLRWLALILAVAMLAGCTGAPAPEGQPQQNITQPGQEPDVSDLIVTRSVPNVTVVLTLGYDGLEFNTTLIVPAGTSLLQALEATTPVEYSNTSIGLEITSINGVAANSTHSWALYASGKLSASNAADYIPKNGDVVGFRLEPNQ
jgi:hypothetical protein